MKYKLMSALAALAVCVAASPTEAAIYVTAEETEAGVLFSYEGSLDTTEMEKTEFQLRDPRRMINAQAGAILFGGGKSYFYVKAMTLPSFGVSGDIYADSETGDDLWLYSDSQIGVYSGYESGTAISGSMLFDGYNFETLGITPGIYEVSMPENSITLTISRNADNVSAVPLPATLPLIMASLGGFALCGRRKS